MIENMCEWGSTNFLFISENVDSLTYYTHLFPLITSVVLGIFVLLSNRNELKHRVLFIVTLIFSVWVFFDLVLWASPTPEDVMFFWSSIVPIEFLLYLTTLYFIYLFNTRRTDAPIIYKIIGILPFIPLVILSHTQLNVVGLAPDCDEGAIEGILITYLYTIELIVVAIAIILTFYNRFFNKSTSPTETNKSFMIGIAGIILLLTFSAGNLTLLFSLPANYEQYKLLGMPIFTAVIAYLIVQYRIFNIKLFGSQALIITLWFLIGSIFFATHAFATKVIAGITFLITLVFGYMLIKSVKKEISQREEIEKLAVVLENANKRLKELDRAKSEFVSIASHQLRGPLTSIRGYASMISEGSYGEIPSTAKAILDKIVDSGKFMASSIEDYLNVSRIQAGNMKYEFSDFDLKKTAEIVTEEYQQVAEKKGLKLTFESNLTGSTTINADIGKTRQILSNLIDNSIKYTEAGAVTVSVGNSAGGIRITIQDTGIGMSAESIEQLFDKFVRAKNANSVNVTGTGLGLYVAKTMVTQMKGKIWAESDGEGKGSRFIVEFPLV